MANQYKIDWWIKQIQEKSQSKIGVVEAMYKRRYTKKLRNKLLKEVSCKPSRWKVELNENWNENKMWQNNSLPCYILFASYK